MLNDQRKNLRIAVTRKFRDEEDDIRNGLSVHLAWWELNTTSGEGHAKYAMASIHDSRIYDFVPVDLSQFIADCRFNNAAGTVPLRSCRAFESGGVASALHIDEW